MKRTPFLFCLLWSLSLCLSACSDDDGLVYPPNVADAIPDGEFRVLCLLLADTDLDGFCAKARAYLGAKGQFVIVNYLRMAIGQEKFGHISPLAAYDADTDRFLILDVARYKYPPVWVSAKELYGAMNTTDADNENKTRGFVLIARTPG